MTAPSEDPGYKGIPRKVQETLSSTADAFIEYVALARPQGQVVYLNKAARALTAQQALPAAFLLAQLHPAWACTLLQEEGMRVALKEGNWRGETALLRADG